VVHGINGSRAELTALAYMLTAAGRQVYVYQYDDFHQGDIESASLLAAELRRLRQTTPHGNEPLEIIGYCMGGIVSRLALNQLQENGTPRAGFPSVRLHAVDVPLD
jgi:thioesterase domain-containing protein